MAKCRIIEKPSTSIAAFSAIYSRFKSKNPSDFYAFYAFLVFNNSLIFLIKTHRAIKNATFFTTSHRLFPKLYSDSVCKKSRFSVHNQAYIVYRPHENEQRNGKYSGY